MGTRNLTAAAAAAALIFVGGGLMVVAYRPEVATTPPLMIDYLLDTDTGTRYELGEPGRPLCQMIGVDDEGLCFCAPLPGESIPIAPVPTADRMSG